MTGTRAEMQLELPGRRLEREGSPMLPDVTGKTRLAVVDNAVSFLETVREAAAEQGAGVEVVGTALNRVDGLALAREKRPEVMLVDLRLSGVEGAAGLVLIEEVLRAVPGCRCVVVTAWPREAEFVAALERGAWGGLSKLELGGREIVAAARLVARGYVVAPRWTVGAQAGAPLRPRLRPLVGAANSAEDRWTLLTPEEREFLRLFVEELTDVPEIARRLKKSRRTLEGYRSSIVRKLRVPSWAHATALYAASLFRPGP